MATTLTDFAFTSSLTGFVCPTFYDNWLCAPPNACAHDQNTGRIYCCGNGGTVSQNACWTIATECANDGSTLGCGNAGETWCCTNETENCITAAGRYNVCLSKSQDLIADISAQVLNDTYSSLSSANPSATAFSFDPASLGAHISTSSSPSTSSPSTTGSETTASTSDSTSSNGQATVTVVANAPSGSHSSLSGGAIGGIVVGAIAGVALILGVMYFLLRRNRTQGNTGPAPGAGVPPPEQTYTPPPAKEPTPLTITPPAPVYNTAPPTQGAWEADGKAAHPTALNTGVSPDPGYIMQTERAYEADGRVMVPEAPSQVPPYPVGPIQQVYEAGGLPSNRHELPGR